MMHKHLREMIEKKEYMIISYGTFNERDLYQTFYHFYAQAMGEDSISVWAKTPMRWNDEDWNDDDNREMAMDIIEKLKDMLSDIAPDGYWFGANEGDSSLFGYWKIPAAEMESEDETEE